MAHDEHGETQSRTVDSLTGGDASYRVVPSMLECSCPEWSAHRSRFPAGDLRRCCKHLVYTLAREPELGPSALAGQPRVLARIKRLAVRREGFPLCRRILPVSIPTGEGKETAADLFFPLDPSAVPWVTVLVGSGVYRYHPAEDRWANDDAPPAPIREALELRIHKALNQEQAARKAAEPATHPPTQAPTPPRDEPRADAADSDTPAAPRAKKPLRFETPGAEDGRVKRRKRRGWWIFLVILLGGVLYWTDNITMPPLPKFVERQLSPGETPMPGAAANATAPSVRDPLEPPLPHDPDEANATAPHPAKSPSQSAPSAQTAPGEPPEWDLREPLSNASLAADLLDLIKRDPDRGRYTISRKVQGGTLLFGADLDLDVIFRIYRGDDGAERRDRWIGHIDHRLQSAATGGSLDAVPDQGS